MNNPNKKSKGAPVVIFAAIAALISVTCYPKFIYNPSQAQVNGTVNAAHALAKTEILSSHNSSNAATLVASSKSTLSENNVQATY